MDSGVVWVSAGKDHSMAVKGDRSLWAWGSNKYGQFGDGTTTDNPTPLEIKTVYTVAVSSEGTGATGDGIYGEGERVNISAGKAPEGRQFKEWTANPEVAFADATKPNTSFVMPDADSTVTAVFELALAQAQSERYSFENSHKNFGATYNVSDSDFEKLVDCVRNMYDETSADPVIKKLQDKRTRDWGGSCFGMAATSILDKKGRLNMKGMVNPSAASLWDMPKPNTDAKVESVINYYHLSQFISEIYNKYDVTHKGELTLAQKLEGLVDNAKSGKLMQFDFWWPGSGHAIVIVGYEPGPNGSHNVLAYDVNYPNENTIVNVSADYATCYIKVGVREPYGDISDVRYTANFDMYDQINFDMYDQINIDGAGGTQMGGIDMNTQIMINAQTTTTVTNDRGQTLEYNAKTGEISGDMTVLFVSYAGGVTADGDSASTVIIEVPASDSFTFEAENRGLDVSVVAPGIYASAESEQADTIVVEKDEGITITGEGTIDFTMSLGLNSDICDMDMVSIEGTAYGEAVLEYDASGDAVAKGDFDGQMALTVFSDTTKVEKFEFATDFDEVTISNELDEISLQVGKGTQKDSNRIRLKDISGDNMNPAPAPGSAAPGKNPFGDVKEADWYYKDVMYAYGIGLINGKGADAFAPGDRLTYAEAVKLAACMHELHTTGKVTLAVGSGAWYQSYVDYAKANGIISKDYEWTKAASRAGYMEIFANALPEEALAAVNDVADNSIPDVPATHAQAWAIYRLYRAGIVQGVDAARNCNPDSNIRRSEVAAILTRMMDPSARVRFTLT